MFKKKKHIPSRNELTTVQEGSCFVPTSKSLKGKLEENMTSINTAKTKFKHYDEKRKSLYRDPTFFEIVIGKVFMATQKKEQTDGLISPDRFYKSLYGYAALFAAEFVFLATQDAKEMYYLRNILRTSSLSEKKPNSKADMKIVTHEVAVEKFEESSFVASLSDITTRDKEKLIQQLCEELSFQYNTNCFGHHKDMSSKTVLKALRLCIKLRRELKANVNCVLGHSSIKKKNRKRLLNLSPFDMLLMKRGTPKIFQNVENAIGLIEESLKSLEAITAWSDERSNLSAYEQWKAEEVNALADIGSCKVFFGVKTETSKESIHDCLGLYIDYV